ncbi:MAG: hypothetical protein LVT47_16350 [Cyanobacteria bacterium LVE1205-1]|jgi:hypothetical protein
MSKNRIDQFGEVFDYGAVNNRSYEHFDSKAYSPDSVFIPTELNSPNWKRFLTVYSLH